MAADDGLSNTVDVINESTALVASAADPRRYQNRLIYRLEVILFTALLSSISGQFQAVYIANYWQVHREELSIIIPDFPHQNITHDTINRVLGMLPPQILAKWLLSLGVPLLEASPQRVFHVDGQAVRASKTEKAQSGRYFFNMYESSTHLLVGQLLIEEKTNEITASLQMFDLVDFRPSDIVTSDALNTQKHLARELTERQILWCFAVKSNQPKLYNEIIYHFNHIDESRFGVEKSVDKGHGRIETRITHVLPARFLSKDILRDWCGLEDGCIIRATNIVERIDKPTTIDTRYFICSKKFDKPTSGEDCADVIRRHWLVEAFHWLCDNVFYQDRTQIKNEVYLQNEILLSKVGINILTKCQESKRMLGGKTLSISAIRNIASTPLLALQVLHYSGLFNEMPKFSLC